jgi:hypothetical protein
MTRRGRKRGREEETMPSGILRSVCRWSVKKETPIIDLFEITALFSNCRAAIATISFNVFEIYLVIVLSVFAMEMV